MKELSCCLASCSLSKSVEFIMLILYTDLRTVGVCTKQSLFCKINFDHSEHFRWKCPKATNLSSNEIRAEIETIPKIPVGRMRNF